MSPFGVVVVLLIHRILLANRRTIRKILYCYGSLYSVWLAREYEGALGSLARVCCKCHVWVQVLVS